jgi:seryl-tRNA synthetase
MLPLSFVREHADEVRENLRKRTAEAPLDQILELDRRRRDLDVETNRLRAELNRVSKLGKPDTPTRQRLREIGDRISLIEKELKPLEEDLQAKLLWLPNLADPSAPVGRGDEDDVVLRTRGERRTFSFEPKPHWELGERLGILELERATKLAGARFFALRAAGAALQRALIAWLLDLWVREHGFTEIYPPFLTKEAALVGSGALPKSRDAVFRVEEQDLWLVPTAEVQLLSFYGDEVLDAKQLPLRVTGYTPCFRHERITAGREVRGIRRVFQFDKVELFVFCRPEESPAELDLLVRLASEALDRLELHYRVKELCTANLAFQAAKAFDLDVWSPGVQDWLEVSSCSNCTDYQSHRANVRMRRSHDARPEALHTLNGSGLGLARTLIAILESNQREDGSIAVPAVLRPYLHGLEEIRPAR